MTSNTRQGGGGHGLSRVYFLFWLVLGAGGIFYVALAAMAPEVLRTADSSQGISAQLATEVASLNTSVADVRKALDKQRADQQALAGGVDSMRNDVGAIKARLADLSVFDQTLIGRVSALEGKAGLKTTQAVTKPAPQTAVATKAVAQTEAPAIEGTVEPGDSEDAVAVDEPAADATAAETPAKAAAPLPIGAQKPTVAAVAAKPVKVATADDASKPSKPYGLDLAVSTSPEALQQMWQLFKEQHGDLLAGLSPRSVASGANVKLVAGPFPSQAAATAACVKLRKANLACSATPFTGSPL